MARNPRRVDAELDALYERVPLMVNCKGLCDASCGPVACSSRERTRVEQESGRTLGVREDGMCSMLTPMGQCSVYEQRPMVCRLWGATVDMICPFGCVPERMLWKEEGFRLLRESLDIGGDPGAFSLLEMVKSALPPSPDDR